MLRQDWKKKTFVPLYEMACECGAPFDINKEDCPHCGEYYYETPTEKRRRIAKSYRKTLLGIGAALGVGAVVATAIVAKKIFR